MKWTLSFICLFLYSSLAQADLQSFEQRFEFIRNDQGQVVMVTDRSITTEFSVRPYIQQIKKMILSEQALMVQKNYYADVTDLMSSEVLEIPDEENKSVTTVLNTRLVRDSLHEVSKLDVEGIFSNSQVMEVFSAYEEKLRISLDQLNPRVIARLDNSQFFYQKTVGHQVVKWGLDFAKRRLSSVPALNTASYVLVELEKMVRERRVYHQNMLMHYLERNSAADLGLTDAEVEQIFSSIYESRIAWFNIFESRQAQAAWQTFGMDRFYQGFRGATNRLRNFRTGYSSLGERHNFAFQEAVVEGERVILNLFDNEGMFKNTPAIAYNYDRPNLVQRRRMVLTLADLGLSFVPMPQFIKDFGSNYMKSFYEQQRLTEGALYGFFEQTGAPEMQDELLSQYFNPLDLSIKL